MKLLQVLFIIFLFTCYYQIASAQNVYKRLTPQESESLITTNAENPNFIILDVRRPSEWNSGHLEGSINRNLYDSDFDQQLDNLPKHKVYLLHCQSGGRSASAFSKMKNLEFAEVYELIGGINNWKKSNLPTTQKVEPKLMLVSHKGFKGSSTDTIKVTITNRANDQLKITAHGINDDHQITHNFNPDIVLEGAEDYTFEIYHAPAYTDNDSTLVWMESNGGNIEFKVIVEEDIATGLENLALNGLSLYPNPARNKLFINGLNAAEPAEILIYNLAGQTVVHQANYSSNSEISLVGLKEGVHMVRVVSGGASFTKKMIIKY